MSCWAAEARQPPGNNSEDINVRSGGKPISHLRQSRLAPSFEVRPCAVTTQGRFVHGGLCRTCWSCPHASSATQSFSLSRWKPTMGCSKICEPRACYFSASSKYAIDSGDPDCPSRNSACFFTHAKNRRAPPQSAPRRPCPRVVRDIYVEVNFREPVSGDRMWTLRMQ